MTKIILFLSLIILLTGCSKTVNRGLIIKISGGYTGVLPCADCEGINYEISLKDDMSYSETKLFLGKNTKPFTSTGRWELEDNNIIKLFKKTDEFSFFEYSKDNLIMLNADKKKYEGPEAEKYDLKRGSMQYVHVDALDSISSSPDSASLKGNWKLIELNGQRPEPEDFTNGFPYLEIDEINNKFYGSTACNKINGGVQISGDLIGFSKFFTTRMECPGDGEKKYIATLKSVDSYKVESGTLSLMASGTTVLKFKR